MVIDYVESRFRVPKNFRPPQAVFHFVFPLHGNPKVPSPAPAAPSVAPALLGKAALWLRARFLFFSFSLKSLKKF